MRNFFQQILRIITSIGASIINYIQTEPISFITIALLVMYVGISLGFIFGWIPDDWTVHNFLKKYISIEFSESSRWIKFHNVIGWLLMIFYTIFSHYKIDKILSNDQFSRIDSVNPRFEIHIITTILLIPLCFIWFCLYFESFSPNYTMDTELLKTDNKLFFWIVSISSILSIVTFILLFWSEKYKGVRLIAFIEMSCVVYLLPLLLNYTLITYLYAEGYTKTIWDNYFGLYLFIAVAVLVFIILYTLHLLIKGYKKKLKFESFDIIALFLSGILILTNVGVIFGFIYYQRDRALNNLNDKSYNDKSYNEHVPGFNGYKQPSVSHYKRIYHKMSDRLFGLLKNKFSEEKNNKLRSIYEKRYDTKDKVVEDLIPIFKNSNISKEIKDNVFKPKGVEALLKGILPEEDIEAYISGWHEIHKCRIPFESYTASFQDEQIKEIEKIIKEKKSEGYPVAVFLTGISDSKRICSMGGKYNSNEELARARAERVKKILLDKIKTIGTDEIFTTSLSSDITPSEKKVILEEMEICAEDKSPVTPKPDKDGLREVIVTVKSRITFSDDKDKEYIVKKVSETVSEYITLLDAMFYSSYTVTTTGYGIVPLDKWVKFFTIFENLIEFLIVTGLISVILSQKSDDDKSEERKCSGSNLTESIL